MSGYTAASHPAPKPQLPAEILLTIAGYCFPTWSDHELWFRLGHSTRVLRAAVAHQAVKTASDKQTALHTKFERHCEGRIIRDTASITRIESYLKAPVTVTSRAPITQNVRHDNDNNDDDDADHENNTSRDTSRRLQRRWVFQGINEEQNEAIFVTGYIPGTDQDLPVRDVEPSGPDPEHSSGPEVETPKDWRFSCKALSLETAETGKIEFDDIGLQAKWVKVERDDSVPASRRRQVLAAFDWRQIWTRKLGRERYCQRVQTEKQRKFKQENEERRQRLVAAAAAAAAGKLSKPAKRGVSTYEDYKLDDDALQA